MPDLATTINAGMTALLNGLSPGATAQNIFSAVPTRSASLFCASVNITGWADNQLNGGSFAGSCVGARTVLWPNHVSVPGSIAFATAGGTVVVVPIASSDQVGSTDIRVLKMGSDIPSTIHRNRVLPTNWRQYFNLIANPPLCIYTRQDQRVYVGQLVADPSNFTLRAVQNSTYSGWFFYPLVAGDSGYPSGLIINGEFVLLFDIHTSDIAGDDVGGKAASVQSVMNSLGTGDVLQTYPLGSFNVIINYTPGTYSVLVPIGVSVGSWKIWSGGGAGSAGLSGGGGGGVDGDTALVLIPGETLTLVVGAGGPIPIGGGGESSLKRGATTLLRATGGQSSNDGGLGGTGFVGPLKHNGGGGFGFGGGGGAGTAQNGEASAANPGGAGGTPDGGAGADGADVGPVVDGEIPGGGGACDGTINESNGGNGAAIFVYTVVPPTPGPGNPGNNPSLLIPLAVL